jgi:hypothetical protein
MQSHLNTRVAIGTSHNQGFTILDDNSLNKLKSTIAKEVCDDIFTKLGSPTDSCQPKVPSLSKSLKDIYLYIARLDLEIEDLGGQLPQQEDMGFDKDHLEQEREKLEEAAADLRSQIATLDVGFSADDKYSDSAYLDSTLQFYRLSTKKMDIVTRSASIVENLIDMTTKQKAKWIALLEDVATTSELEKIMSKFADYKALLENEIDTNREESIYFDDLFAWLTQDGYSMVCDDFSNLNDLLLKITASRTFDLEYLRAEYRNVPTDTVPIKDKFSTEQLSNNAEVLTADLAKFALLDNVPADELPDMVQQYQIKIKKWQAINKELNARRLNVDVSRANFIRNLEQSADLVDVYSRFIELLLHNDAIAHKWKAVNMLRQFADRREDLVRINQLSQNLQDVEAQLAETVVRLHALAQNQQAKGARQLHFKLSRLREQKIAQAEQLHAEELHQYVEGLVSHHTHVYEKLQKATIAKYNVNISNEHFLQIKPAVWNISLAQKPSDSALIEIKSIAEKVNQIATAQNEIMQRLPVNSAAITTETTPEGDHTPEPEPEVVAEEDTEQHDNIENKYAQLDLPQITVDGIKKVNDFKEAAEIYNTPDFITKSKSNMEYFCKACDKTLKFTGNKPANHCKTTLHNKKFMQWVTKNKLIL